MRIAGALVAAVLLASLTACGGSGGDAAGPAGPSSSATAAAAAATAATSAGGGQEEFLRLTAAHMCDVQGTVYDDPSKIAAAYDQAPEYPGLTDQQVADFAKRVTGDPDFSALLLEQVATACGG